MDLYSRRIKGWSLQAHMKEELISDCLKKALLGYTPLAGLIHHSDQGVQYTSTAYRKLLQENKAIQSMSRKGNCYDKAFMESCFGTLKAELLEGGGFLNIEDARTEIFDYIQAYYNRKPKHSALGYLSPEQFESQLKHKYCPAK
jgi:transposase InsO family protein